MPKHILDAYRDGFVWVPYCKICSQENPLEGSECPGKYQPVIRTKHKGFNTGIEKGVDATNGKS